MPLLLFILLFLASSLFWAWILFANGAETLEGSFLSGFLLYHHAPQWSATGIRFFTAGTWTLQTLWFLAALFLPALRPFAI